MRVLHHLSWQRFSEIKQVSYSEQLPTQYQNNKNYIFLPLSCGVQQPWWDLLLGVIVGMNQNQNVLLTSSSCKEHFLLSCGWKLQYPSFLTVAISQERALRSSTYGFVVCSAYTERRFPLHKICESRVYALLLLNLVPQNCKKIANWATWQVRNCDYHTLYFVSLSLCTA